MVDRPYTRAYYQFDEVDRVFIGALPEHATHVEIVVPPHQYAIRYMFDLATERGKMMDLETCLDRMFMAGQKDKAAEVRSMFKKVLEIQ